jgi:hypothetical protein
MRKGYFSAVGASAGVFLAVCLAADYGLPEAKATGFCVYLDPAQCTTPAWCSQVGQCNACRTGNGSLMWSLYSWVKPVGQNCGDSTSNVCAWCQDIVCGTGNTYSDSNCTQQVPTSNCYLNGCLQPQ